MITNTTEVLLSGSKISGNPVHKSVGLLVKDKGDQRKGRLRIGTIVGDHDIIFAGTDEVIEIKHRAYSRKIFANGAINAAKFLSGKEAGMYDMSDVLG